MEEELNYLSEKIANFESEITDLEFTLHSGIQDNLIELLTTEIKDTRCEMLILENILNALTISELNK